MNYSDFIARKAMRATPCGLSDDDIIDNPKLFGFQRDVVRLALKRGRCVIMLDTGMGKGFIALDMLSQISAYTGQPTLIISPLAVSRQFVREAEKYGTKIKVVKEASDVDPTWINVVNYERIERLDLSQFAGVACDEASIIKNYTGKTRNAIIQGLANTPFRFFLTATPAPNDHTEFGNYVEACGVMSYQEYLSRYYVHDGETTQEWRLKRHAVKDHWAFLASLCIVAKRPSDLGHHEEDARFELPPLTFVEHRLPAPQEEVLETGMLFAEHAATLSEQRAIRRKTMEVRVAECARIANEAKGQVLVWCELNDEGDALEKAIPDAIQVSGSDKEDAKEENLIGFGANKYRVLVTKPKIASQGLNYQSCNEMVFCGVSHSFEAIYQATRRCWRFGQTKPVTVHLVYDEREGAIIENIERKQSAFDSSIQEMVAVTSKAFLADMGRAVKRESMVYAPKKEMSWPW